MNTNEKIAKWLGYKLEECGDSKEWIKRKRGKIIDILGVFDLDFLHDRNQQKWIKDKLIELGYIISVIVDSDGANVTIYNDEILENQAIETSSDKDEDLAFIQAVEQLIDKENE